MCMRVHLQAHVLCPAGTATNIFQASIDDAKTADDEADAQRLADAAGTIAISPDLLVERMAEGVARGIFYIVGEDPSSGIDFPAADLRMKADAVLTGRPPVGWFKTPDGEGRERVRACLRGA